MMDVGLDSLLPMQEALVVTNADSAASLNGATVVSTHPYLWKIADGPLVHLDYSG